MLQALLKIIIIILVVLGISSLIPAKFKEQAYTRTKAALSEIIPKSVKEKIKDTATPPMERRAELLDQLEKNISAIKEGLMKKETIGEKNATTGAEEQKNNEELVKKIEETEKLVKKIEQTANDGGVINEIKTTVYEKITGKEPSSSTSCTTQ